MRVITATKDDHGVYQADIQTGTPVKVTYRGGPAVYGRVAKVTGGVIEVLTPGGSRIESGLCWVEPLTTEDDLARLAYWDEEQRRAGMEPEIP